MYYRKDNDADVAVYLGDVHKRLNSLYNLDQENTRELTRAKKMTSFLQKIKNYSLDLSGGFRDKRDKAFIQEIFNSLPPTISKDFIFKRKPEENSQQTGDRFEIELAAIFHIIATGTPPIGVSPIKVGTENAISSEDMDKFLRENFKITKVEGNNVTDFYMELNKKLEHDLPNECIKAICALLPNRYKKIESLNKPKGTEYQFFLSDVQAKTDLSHQRINITKTWEITKKTQEAISIIQSANFSAKTYSKGAIKIGTTNGIRAYFSILDGIKDKTINNYKSKASSFLHGVSLINVKDKSLNDRKNRSELVEKYIYQMKFIYELTGLGQKGNSLLPELIKADYLLYNENDGKNIYVFPTKTVIKTMYDMTEKRYNKQDPFNSEVIINKTWVNKLIALVKSAET